MLTNGVESKIYDFNPLQEHFGGFVNFVGLRDVNQWCVAWDLQVWSLMVVIWLSFNGLLVLC